MSTFLAKIRLFEQQLRKGVIFFKIVGKSFNTPFENCMKTVKNVMTLISDTIYLHSNTMQNIHFT